MRRLHKVQERRSVLEQPTAEMQALRALLIQDGHFPSRRTWERRLKALPAQIGCVGRYLGALLRPWAAYGRAIALDSTVRVARGRVWRKKDREAGVGPPPSIDTEAHWTQSGWHGFFYGWKLHLATVAAGVWMPLAAERTAAHVADNEVAPALWREVPLGPCTVPGDLHDNAPHVQQACDPQGRLWITTRYGPIAIQIRVPVPPGRGAGLGETVP
ncbi:MAG: hypothetical protein IT210_26350 [Armatimonadetes bacterium]|nr:hypothetical protein [Armatimonadota bacterium]